MFYDPKERRASKKTGGKSANKKRRMRRKECFRGVPREDKRETRTVAPRITNS